jgi:hypothetical protein
MQVVVLNSNLADHNDKSWQIGREYANRVNADIQDYTKSWSYLSPNIQADCYVFAKDHQALSTKPEKPIEKVAKKDKEIKAPNTCKDYNTKSNTGENCAWELEEANVGKRCNRLHVCSNCIKSGAQRSHRAIDCSNASNSKNATPFQTQGSG